MWSVSCHFVAVEMEWVLETFGIWLKCLLGGYHWTWPSARPDIIVCQCDMKQKTYDTDRRTLLFEQVDCAFPHSNAQECYVGEF